MSQTLTDNDYEVIRKLVYQHSRIDLGGNKKELVTARLSKRVRVLGISSLADYVRMVSTNEGEEELVHLIDAISTNHTFFFREIKHFEFMTSHALPEAIERSKQNLEKEFRVWSAASSSGEEAYSIAIQLQDHFSRIPGWNWQIQSTDISTKILEKAKQAVYPEDRLREVRPEWLRLYFQKGINQWEGHYRVKEELKKKIEWHHVNLLQPRYPFAKPFHCIWCRNVMIYFDRVTQEQLVEKLFEFLVPGGYLMIGHSESLTGITHRLKSVRPAIYQNHYNSKSTMQVPKIRVLIVDDSVVVRKSLSDQLNSDSQIEVVGTAIDPYVARDKILELRPDVITLDIEMPRMDGLTFLKILMKHRPIPVIILSSLSQAGSDIAMQALQLGAVDVMGKPSGAYSLGDVGYQMIEKIKAAASAKLKNLPGMVAAPADPLKTEANSNRVVAGPRAPTNSLGRPKTSLPQVLTSTGVFNNRQTILLGASTGGTEALKEVLTRMPKNLPPILIVQHIPPHFSKAFADRLNTLCDFDVREAKEGDLAEPGLALVAPGDFHMMLQWIGGKYRVNLKKGPAVWHQRPAVDVLFSSAVEAGAGEHAVVGLFTGMGRDGAEGMLKLREKGATTYAQNEETCVVFGMPRVAMELGAAEKMLPLLDFPQALISAAQRKARKLVSAD